MRRIIFNDNAIGWSYMDGCNEAYLKYNIDYLRNKYNARGYLYLNEIYESLGIAWNPDDENVCFKKPWSFSIWFEPIEGRQYEIFVK